MSNKNELSLTGHNVKPIIIQLPQQQQHSRNASMIQKMIKQTNTNIKYSGGYKNKQSSIRGNSEAKKQLYRPQQQNNAINASNVSNSKNVYDELGVSKVQPKYRIIDQNSKVINAGKSTMQQLQDKIELLKQDRQNRNSHLLFKPNDQYTIVNNQSRYQNVVHAQSSLDAITLQNIQAKLQAHRRNLKNVEDQYNAKKGKTRDADRFGNTAMSMKFNIDVDRQYAELKMEKDKIYELARKRQDMQPDEVQFEELWEMKKKSNPKLAEYDAKYQQYLVNKDAKNLIGATFRNSLYTWDKYKQPGAQKHKQKSLVKAGHEYAYSNQKIKHHNRSVSKQKQGQNEQNLSKTIQNTSKYGPDGLASVRDIKDVLTTKDDKFISAYIFTQIDTGKIGLISKQQLHDYILSQQHVINGYNIDTKWLFTDLDNFQTKRKGMFTKAQLTIFLATLQKIEHPKLTLTNLQTFKSNQSQLGTTLKTNKQIISTFPKNKGIFQKIFNTIDFNDDKIIKRQDFIQNIYIDSDCAKLLDEQAIKINVINKSITYRQILGFILDDYQKQRNQKLKKSKQYITFSRFCEYFDIPQSLDLNKIDKIAEKKKKDKSKQYQIFDLPQQYLQLLKDIFNSIPRIYQDYIVSADFVQTALRDPQILALGDQLCRIESIETKLPIQTLQTTLHRMQKECDQYSTWDVMKLYFSRRGRPLDWDFALIAQKRQLRNQKLKQQRKGISKSKVKQAQNYFQYTDQLRNRSKQKINKIPDKYTVPQPFDIVDMKQKPNLQEAQQGQKQFEQLKKQFKANPVNKQILQPKPDLIMGKIKKKSQKQIRPEYKYEDYENDRIQRALKRAQQQYEIDQKIQAIKQKTQIKALDIGIDLTKKYQDVIKEQKQKIRQNSKYKPTVPKAGQNLYPKNPSQDLAKKLEKVKQNMEKADEVNKRKKQQLQQEKKRAREKNKRVQQKLNKNKLKDEQQESKRDKILTDGIDFKPKINPKELSKKQIQQIAKGKQQRLRKQQELQQMRLKVLQEKKRKILQYQKKQKKLDIQGLADQQILDRIDQVNFEDLLLDQQSKRQYRKQFDDKNKTRKQLKERELGLAGRQKAALEAQQRRIMQQKRKYKQKVQKDKTTPKQNYSRISQKGQKSASFNKDLNFHRSKALRRYRAIMNDQKPLSQFDRYSLYAKEQDAAQSNLGGNQDIGDEEKIQQENQDNDQS